MIKILITAAVSVAFTYSAIWSVMGGINKSEVVECNEWKAQSQEFSGFFLAKWQNEQCRAHGIIINAPVM